MNTPRRGAGKQNKATDRAAGRAADRETEAPTRFGRERMSRLGNALASDAMIIFMLSVVMVEATALFFWHRATGKGPEPVELFSFLGAGASLMLAMYFVKRIKKSALPFATALLSALVFHIWHMALLWGR